ncbi:hypothetical protein HD806DRAFT_534315 [Xylariaceae sp. AK1471]|nr:hypothetical protein HD806DRAFT_534315 [Xylariaceae sp. AK1471]
MNLWEDFLARSEEGVSESPRWTEMVPEEHGGNSELTSPTGQDYLLNAKTKKRVCGGYRWNTWDLSACHYNGRE